MFRNPESKARKTVKDLACAQYYIHISNYCGLLTLLGVFDAVSRELPYCRHYT
jgi:hypothetical protein